MAIIKIEQMMMSPSKYSLKAPYSMKPKVIVVHNTYNSASARNEISYMIGNSNAVSFHYAVDEKGAVQGIPLNRNAWHCGNRWGNLNGIGVEIARSTSDTALYLQAEDNGAKLVALLCVQYGFTINDVKIHRDFSGKKCPHRMIDLGRWDKTFKDNVQKYINQIKSGTTVNEDNHIQLGGKDIMNKLQAKMAISCQDPEKYAYELARVTSYLQKSELNYVYTSSKVSADYEINIPIIAIGGTPASHTSYATHFIGNKEQADLFHSSQKNWDKLKIRR